MPTPTQQRRPPWPAARSSRPHPAFTCPRAPSSPPHTHTGRPGDPDPQVRPQHARQGVAGQVGPLLVRVGGWVWGGRGRAGRAYSKMCGCPAGRFAPPNTPAPHRPLTPLPPPPQRGAPGRRRDPDAPREERGRELRVGRVGEGRRAGRWGGAGLPCLPAPSGSPAHPRLHCSPCCCNAAGWTCQVALPLVCLLQFSFNNVSPDDTISFHVYGVCVCGGCGVGGFYV